MKPRNRILYRVRKQYDKYDRVIHKLDYAAYQGPFEFRYDYKSLGY